MNGSFTSVHPGMKRKRKPGRSVEAETCAPKAGCAKFAIYDKIVAVYDKKMLWRANLYIDKKEESLGGVDRNDAHPWNAPASNGTTTGTWGDTANPQITLASWNGNDWGYNDWNDMTATIKGGQISINPWTRWNDDAEVYNSVAYGWGCYDTVADFNSELNALNEAILAKRNDFPTTYGTFSWNNTTLAPDNSWEKYIFPANTKNSNSSCIKVTKTADGITRTKKLKDLDGETTSNTEQTNHLFTLNNISVPGLSTYWSEEYVNPNASIANRVDMYVSGLHDLHTSGLDCSGLVTAAMGYKENENFVYVAADGNKLGTTSFVNNDNTIQLRGAGWLLESDKQSEITQKEADQKLLSHAVPGDVFVKPGDHIVIITNLNYNENNTVITSFKDVDVIHSTKGLNLEGFENEWKVMSSTASVVSSKFNQYELRRLIK